MDERQLSWFRLALLTDFSYGQVRKILDYCGDPEESMLLTPEDLFGAGLSVSSRQCELFSGTGDRYFLQERAAALSESGTRFFSIEDAEYPQELSDIPDPPLGLFVRGALPERGRDTVAVIGSRRCSPYGREMAGFFGRELSKQGVNIVSGMASGIDGYSQRGAVAARSLGAGAGRTFGVLGGGPDICYPKENIDLFTALLDNGNGLISERPPGYFSRAYDFPRRNRIISGLSRAVLVIEAAEKSGTWITVNDALEQGREIFAMPGRVSDYLSRGTNELIKNGAHVLTCPEDVLQLLGRRVERDTLKSGRVLLLGDEQAVYGCIAADPVSVDELLERTGLPAGTLLEILVRLEIKGLLRKAGISGYIRTM